MKKLFTGFVIGVAALFVFIFFGGASYVKELGSRTEEAGVTLERFEKDLKRTAKNARRTVDETFDDTLGRTKDKVDKVKEYIP